MLVPPFNSPTQGAQGWGGWEAIWCWGVGIPSYSPGGGVAASRRQWFALTYSLLGLGPRISCLWDLLGPGYHVQSLD